DPAGDEDLEGDGDDEDEAEGRVDRGRKGEDSPAGVEGGGEDAPGPQVREEIGGEGPEALGEAVKMPEARDEDVASDAPAEEAERDDEQRHEPGAERILEDWV